MLTARPWQGAPSATGGGRARAGGPWWGWGSGGGAHIWGSITFLRTNHWHWGSGGRVGRGPRLGQPHLPENELPVHVHGQVSEVQEHLVRGQLLLDDIIPIDGHDGHADEKVEVVGLGRGVEFRHGL